MESGDDYYGQCEEAENWRDIVAIAAGGMTVYGVKANGTVVATGSPYFLENASESGLAG